MNDRRSKIQLFTFYRSKIFHSRIFPCIEVDVILEAPLVKKNINHLKESKAITEKNQIISYFYQNIEILNNSGINQSEERKLKLLHKNS